MAPAHDDISVVGKGDASGGVAITDGASWTAVANTAFTDDINAVAYGNGRFVAVGSGGRMAYCDW